MSVTAGRIQFAGSFMNDDNYEEKKFSSSQVHLSKSELLFFFFQSDKLFILLSIMTVFPKGFSRI